MNYESLEAGRFRKHLILDHGWEQDRAWAETNVADHAESHPECATAQRQSPNQ